jgi:transcriptional regulator with XRE-family HTH domain
MPFDEALYQQLLGHELRDLRHRRGWTRNQLRQHLRHGKSIATLAAYEQGTRHFTVARLADMCDAMDEHPHELLARVHHRMALDHPGQIVIDLTTISTSAHPDLQPLRVWARDKLLTHTASSPQQHTVQIDTPTLESIALLCGMSSTELRSHLHRAT